MAGGYATLDYSDVRAFPYAVGGRVYRTLREARMALPAARRMWPLDQLEVVDRVTGRRVP